MWILHDLLLKNGAILVTAKSSKLHSLYIQLHSGEEITKKNMSQRQRD
jgi:hypothetical protein